MFIHYKPPHNGINKVVLYAIVSQEVRLMTGSLLLLLGARTLTNQHICSEQVVPLIFYETVRREVDVLSETEAYEVNFEPQDLFKVTNHEKENLQLNYPRIKDGQRLMAQGLCPGFTISQLNSVAQDFLDLALATLFTTEPRGLML